MDFDNTSAPRSALQVAQEWACLGFRVFPIVPGTKRPAIDGWKEHATRSPARIDQWWGPRCAYELTEVGLALGPDTMVLDIDVKKNAPGLASMEDLQLEFGNFVEGARTVITPSGGLHYYFKTPAPLGCRLGLWPGIDVKSVGGYVVAPGGTSADSPGRVYRDLGGDFPEVPAWLAERVGAPRERKATDPVTDLDQPAAVARGGAYLASVAGALLGARGSTAYRVAATLKDFGLSEPMTLNLMLKGWADRCEPPMPDEELEESVAHAYEYGKEPPGVMAAEAVFLPIEDSSPDGGGDFEVPVDGAVAPTQFDRFRDIEPDLTRLHLVKNTLPRTGIVGIIGAYGARKSQILMDLETSTAAGRPWLGRKTLAGIAVHVSGEGREGIKGRIKATRDAMGLAGVDVPLFVALAPPNLRSRDSVVAFIDSCKALSVELGLPMRVIGFDTLTSLVPGMDQSSAEEMSGFVGMLRLIEQALDCLVVIVHHLGKDRARGAMGSVVLPGAFDTEMTVEDAGNGRTRLSFTKQRDFEKGEPVAFQQHVAVLGHDLDGDEVTAAYSVWDPDADVTDASAEAAFAVPPAQAEALRSFDQAEVMAGEVRNGLTCVPGAAWARAHAELFGIKKANGFRELRARLKKEEVVIEPEKGWWALA